MKKLLTILALIALSGCSSTQPNDKDRYADSPIPESSKSMDEIYREIGSGGGFNGTSTYDATEALTPKRKPTWEELSVEPYTLNNTVKTEFRKLDNPTLYIYYPPSLTKEDRVPRPGWMTEFKMYDKDEYALPGEVNTVRY